MTAAHHANMVPADELSFRRSFARTTAKGELNTAQATPSNAGGDQTLLF